MTFDEIMKQALGETIDDRLEQMRTITSKPKFPLSYRLWEHKTLRDLRRNRYNEHWTLKRARYIVVAMTAVFSLLIGATAYAAVVLIGRFGFEDKVDYSKMLIETHPSDKTVIEEYYGLPEEDGWELTESDIISSSSTLIYKCDGKEITFDQMLINNETILHISTDRAEVEPLSLYEENDGFVLDFGNDDTLLYWIYDGYLFEISGNINKIDAINLAYSTKIINVPKNF